jgi:hypothetical protein
LNKPDSTRLFLLLATLVAVAVVTATALYNYRANRWGIYAEDYQTFHGLIRPNRHWMKTDFFIREDHGYDCILFGSSRVAAIDTRKLEGNCYNFTHSGGLPVNHLSALKLFLESEIPLKRVYLGLDDISYQWDPGESSDQYMRRGYPRDLVEWFEAQVFYLLTPMNLRDLGLVTGEAALYPMPWHVRDPIRDWQRIHSESLEFYDDPIGQDARFRHLRGTMEAGAFHGAEAAESVREFIALAEAHGIEVIMFFNPMHYKTYLTRDYELYSQFKRLVAEVAGFYDFTGFNRFSVDNRYWKETSHYTTIVGDHILAVIQGASDAEPGFGRFTTAKNFDALEAAQLKTDIEYLPEIVRKEGLIGIPPRFSQLWAERGYLKPAGMRQPSGEANRALLDGGHIKLKRGDSQTEFRPGIWTDLPIDTLFLLNFSAQVHSRPSFTFSVRQSREKDGEDWRYFRYVGRRGENSGHIAGYVTYDKPPIRLQLGPGLVDQAWKPVELFEVHPGLTEPPRS